MAVERDPARVRAREPTRGTSGCVACTQPSKVVVVDEFVNKNCDKMAEQELFKMAGLVYEDKVVGPARAEGVAVPRWDWRTIAVHYRFHRLDVRFRRARSSAASARCRSGWSSP